VENPEERMKRLQNEVMGVAATPEDRQPAPSKASQSIEEEIKKYKVSFLPSHGPPRV
jgi:hypothetical protein